MDSFAAVQCILFLSCVRVKIISCFCMFLFHELDAAILIAFKDLNFFKRTANGISEMAGHPLNIPDIHIIAPIGISYFALILIGYLTDVYWKKYEPERGFLRFTLFSGYFPQLSSGPFVRYDKMKEELFTAKRFDYSRIILGIERIISRNLSCQND